MSYSSASLLASSMCERAIFQSLHRRLRNEEKDSAIIKTLGEAAIARATSNDSALLAMARSGNPIVHQTGAAYVRVSIRQSYQP